MTPITTGQDQIEELEELYKHLVISPSSALKTHYSPYEIIRRMDSSFVQNSTLFLTGKFIDEEIAATSCIDTSLAIAVVFSGAIEAKKMLPQLTYKYHRQYNVKLTDSSRLQLTVNSLFSGEMLVHIKDVLLPDGGKSLNPKDIENIALEHLNKRFFSYLESRISDCTKAKSDQPISVLLPNSLKETPYDFNSAVFEKLLGEIDSNRDKTSQKVSYVYYIAIDISRVSGNWGFYHVFAIEQFFKDSYHIYSSWKKRCSLANFLKDRKVLNYTELTEFMSDFRSILSINRLSPTIQWSDIDIMEKLFSVSKLPPRRISIFDTKSNSFNGLCLRYISSQVNPEECLKNFRSLQ